jgi:hypothetical protein
LFLLKSGLWSLVFGFWFLIVSSVYICGFFSSTGLALSVQHLKNNRRHSENLCIPRSRR